MKTYRITKYNPEYLSKTGIYQKEDWTSISDIGKYYDEIEFTIDDYIYIEDKFIKVIEQLLNKFIVENIELRNLEKYYYRAFEYLQEDANDNNLKLLFDKLYDNYKFQFKGELLNSVRLILRENIWGEIYFGDSLQKIEFGFDYYIYLTVDESSQSYIDFIHNLGLYIDGI